jgi:hypothetical protein
MEYSWATSVFIAVSGSALVVALVVVLVVVAVVARYMAESVKEDGDPIESSQNDANQLLRQIEANTAKTAFWTKVVGVPVLIGLIIGALASMAQCS